MYKNIIFDLGNVLLSFNPKDYLKSKISEDRIDDVYKAIFKSEEWVMLDRGTITEKDAINRIIERNNTYRDDINLAFKDWYDILRPIEEAVEVLTKLKKNGYNVYYLSNFHELAFKEVTTKNNFFELFDGGVGQETLGANFKLTGWGGNTCTYLGLQPTNGRNKYHYIEIYVKDQSGAAEDFISDPLLKIIISIVVSYS